MNELPEQELVRVLEENEQLNDKLTVVKAWVDMMRYDEIPEGVRVALYGPEGSHEYGGKP